MLLVGAEIMVWRGSGAGIVVSGYTREGGTFTVTSNQFASSLGAPERGQRVIVNGEISVIDQADEAAHPGSAFWINAMVIAQVLIIVDPFFVGTVKSRGIGKTPELISRYVLGTFAK